MFRSFFKLAINNLLRNKASSAIALVGLTIGFAVFLLSQLLVSYETNHDWMFSNRAQIYTVGSEFSPSSGEPISEFPSTKTAYYSHFKKGIPEIKAIARSVHKSKIVSIAGNHNYYSLRFVDPQFSQIFQFKTLHGSAQVNTGLVITESIALKWFGVNNAVGKQVLLDKNQAVTITGVIEDVAADSHFNSSYLPDSQLEILAPINLLTQLGEADPNHDWRNLPASNMLYILLPESKTQSWLQQQVNQVFTTHTPEIYRDYISGLIVRPLREANLQVWFALGFPILEVIELLGFLVLLIALINYSNLTLSHSFSRARELGLRQAFGASPASLLLQFTVENLVITLLAALTALSCVELFIPVFNQATAKSVSLHYPRLVGVLMVTALILSIVAAIYPIFLVLKGKVIDSLHNHFVKGRPGQLLRQMMVTLQFAIAIFILATVSIIYFQNQMILQIADQFPRQSVLVMDKVANQLSPQQRAAFVQRANQLSSIDSISFSSGIPFHKAGQVKQIAPKLESASLFKAFEVSVDDAFFQVFDMAVIHGRKLSNREDINTEQDQPINAVINQKLAEVMHLGSGEQVLGKTFFARTNESEQKMQGYRVVGMTQNDYFLGVHVKPKPLIYSVSNGYYDFISVRYSGENSERVEQQLAPIWKGFFAQQPMQVKPLSFYSNLFYRIPVGISKILFIFAVIAISLALFGLYGLSAFAAKRRQKEIAVRKVMGADTSTLLWLLISDFLKPIFAAIIIAAPLAYFTSNIYLDFFPVRLTWVTPAIFAAALVAIAFGVFTVIGHALTTAQKRPAATLRADE